MKSQKNIESDNPFMIEIIHIMSIIEFISVQHESGINMKQALEISLNHYSTDAYTLYEII